MLYFSIKVSFLRKEQGERTTSNHKTEKRSKSESLTQSSTCFVSSFGLICLHPLAPLPRARSGAGASSRPPTIPLSRHFFLFLSRSGLTRLLRLLPHTYYYKSQFTQSRHVATQQSRKSRRGRRHGVRGGLAASALEGLVEGDNGGVALEDVRREGAALVHLLHLLPRAQEVALPQGVL